MSFPFLIWQETPSYGAIVFRDGISIVDYTSDVMTGPQILCRSLTYTGSCKEYCNFFGQILMIGRYVHDSKKHSRWFHAIPSMKKSLFSSLSSFLLAYYIQLIDCLSLFLLNNIWFRYLLLSLVHPRGSTPHQNHLLHSVPSFSGVSSLIFFFQYISLVWTEKRKLKFLLLAGSIAEDVFSVEIIVPQFSW